MLGNDDVRAGSGDDTVYVNASSGDKLQGESGFDTLHLSHTTNEAWNFSLASGISTSGFSAIGFEELHFSGGDGAESVTGGVNDDWLLGGGNSDTLSGASGRDFRYSGRQ
jgi:Ca2+-binding RTX toxin-like protein